MKPNPLIPLSRVVANDTTLASWQRRREREQALLRCVRRELPPAIAERVGVADGCGPVLELAAGAGAIATVLRQRGPELLAALQRQGWEFSGMRVRVQPRCPVPETRKGLPRQWDSTSRRPLQRLEAELPPGPLRTALTRLLRGR